MPLLITGEPGTGKTQLAYRLAAELYGGEPLRFNTKSASVASELFYQFDNIGYFSASQRAALNKQAQPAAREFIRYRALGAAILCSHPWDDVRAGVADAQRDELSLIANRASVVLIDEIDKAPRDFPNDLLDQIENQAFEIPELRVDRIASAPNKRPIVVITSNSEKQLPEAFLRRCVYHHIEIPSDPAKRLALVRAILEKRLQVMAKREGAGFDGALAAFFKLREDAAVEKKPTTSELLDWLRALNARQFDFSRTIGEQNDGVIACVGALAKTKTDRERLIKLLVLKEQA
jgi:MoxR-like ATPase